MNPPTFLANAIKLIKSNSPEILTALGVSGVVTTAYLSAKASTQAIKMIDKEQDRLDRYEKSHPLDNKEKAKLVWKLYIPTGISGALTIGCIVGASKANGARTAAAMTAYSLTEHAFSEYREKVVEEIGKGKERKIRDEIAQDRVNKRPLGDKELVVIGDGQVLCCELYTGRYLKSDMESLRRAQNDINARIVNEIHVCLEEFYDLIGLPYTSASSQMGWDSDKLMELEFTSVLSTKGEPCLAFDYNYVKPIF